MTAHDRHDRTWRFLQTAFPWVEPPGIDALRETADRIEVTLSLGADDARCAQTQLTMLAVVNTVGRLPVRLSIRAPDEDTATPAPPYRGETLHRTLGDLTSRLDRPVDIATFPGPQPEAVAIATPRGHYRYHYATDGWSAYMGAVASAGTDAFNPASAYFTACMIGGEVLRAWARLAADMGAGEPGPSFTARTRPAADRSVNLWAPGTTAPGPTADASRLPPIDWAGAGAVNQATLAVMAATPGWSPRGRVIDPKALDPPDLNRSSLSFHADIGQPKASVVTELLSSDDLDAVRGTYPRDLDGSRAPWIIAGTDDPVVRTAIQRLWPERLIVTATEDVFGYVAWHAPERIDLACAGCGPMVTLEGDEPMPTSAPTSMAAGVVAAATLLRLAFASDVPGRTDILTLRLDAEHALDASSPSPMNGCPTCGTRP